MTGSSIRQTNKTHLPLGIGGIWLCGVEAGVGGFKSPPSAMELLVDCGVWGPWREPDPAVPCNKKRRSFGTLYFYVLNLYASTRTSIEPQNKFLGGIV